MTPRSLFLIILKSFGIFSLKYIIETLPGLAGRLLYLVGSHELTEGFRSLFFNIIIMGVYFLVSMLFILRTEGIIDRFHLDKGFRETTFNFGMSMASVLQIAVIVTGGVIVIVEVPEMCRFLFIGIFEGSTRSYLGVDPPVTAAVFAIAKIMMGLLLIANRKKLVAMMTHTEQEDIQSTGLDSED